MKKLLFLLIFPCLTVLGQDLSQMRRYLQTGQNSEQQALAMISAAQQGFQKTKNSTYLGFEAIGNFYLAKNSGNPFKKLSYFNQGRKKLDAAIAREPKNPELRVLRLATQENAPAVLNYNKEIAADRNFLKSSYQNIQDEELKRYIKKYLKL